VEGMRAMAYMDMAHILEEKGLENSLVVKEVCLLLLILIFLLLLFLLLILLLLLLLLLLFIFFFINIIIYIFLFHLVGDCGNRRSRKYEGEFSKTLVHVNNLPLDLTAEQLAQPFVNYKGW
jgi:Flp pilus assembly protein TadB